MPIELPDLGITYYPITKSGSTSVKHALMELAGKAALIVDVDNDVHRHLGTFLVNPFHPLHDGCAKRFTIVREPLERILSTYSNRVAHLRVLLQSERNELDRLGLSLEPSLETFILNIEKYCLVSEDLRLHTASPRLFVGGSLFQFEHVFRVEQMDEVQAFLSRAAGRHVEIPRLQIGGPKYKASDLSAEALAKALRFCRYDYAFLVDYYDPQRWGGIPPGSPDDPSTLSVAGGMKRDATVTYARTPRNLRLFLSKRPLKNPSFGD